MAFYLSCALILSAAWLNASDIFIVSYRAQIKNAVVISESFHFSKAMTPIKSTKAQTLKLYSPNETDIHTFIHTNKDDIIEFLMHYGAHTRSDEHTQNSMSTSLISLSFAPTYVTVDFNDDYGTITRLIHK